jgi:hypothetical protein
MNHLALAALHRWRDDIELRLCECGHLESEHDSSDEGRCYPFDGDICECETFKRKDSK